MVPGPDGLSVDGYWTKGPVENGWRAQLKSPDIGPDGARDETNGPIRWKPSSCLQHAARGVNRLKQEVPDGDLLWSGGPLVVFLVVPLFPNQARQQGQPGPSSDPEHLELGPSNLGLDGAARGTLAVAGTDDRFGYATKVPRELARTPCKLHTYLRYTRSLQPSQSLDCISRTLLLLLPLLLPLLLHCCKSTATAMATSPATATVRPSCLSLHAAAAATTGHLYYAVAVVTKIRPASSVHHADEVPPITSGTCACAGPQTAASPEALVCSCATTQTAQPTDVGRRLAKALLYLVLY
ncbi:hypothetical protein CKAH01_12608 [Colletotrichum kahawae]|uniref:Uncharacterized protein n=1 Tax=Colletotrichum kahawae TaxID=34407 RepID=A0AAD9YT84_COLKA|nr:hypothetical protein CKAH01_12608 [Colletotrichum kahawae]